MLTFVGEFLGLMALMFKPSVTFILTERLAGDDSEVGEAIGALHACGFVGAILGIIGAAVTVSAFGVAGFLFSAIGPLGATACLIYYKNVVAKPVLEFKNNEYIED